MCDSSIKVNISGINLLLNTDITKNIIDNHTLIAALSVIDFFSFSGSRFQYFFTV